MTEHVWRTVIREMHGEFSTCSKCGLSRLVTLSGIFYFVQFSEPFLQCRSPYREEKFDATI